MSRLYSLYAKARGGPFDGYGPNNRAGVWEYRVRASSSRQALRLAVREQFARFEGDAGVVQIEWDWWNTGGLRAFDCPACRAQKGCPEHRVLAPYLAGAAFVP